MLMIVSQSLTSINRVRFSNPTLLRNIEYMRGGDVMTWLFLLVFLIVSYYFVIKSKSKSIEKSFSFLSLLMFMLIATPIWNERIFDYIIDISPFLPFVFGLLGILFGWFGIKEGTRASFILINSLALLFYLIVFLMGTVGFQEP